MSAARTGPGDERAAVPSGAPGPTSSETSTREIMRQLPLFAGLSADDLDQLYEMATTKRVPAGEWILREGEYGDALFIIIDGELEVTRQEGDSELVLAIRGPGEFVGEMALLEEAPRSASARATRDTELLVISRTAFETLLACSRSAPLTVLRAVTERVRSTEAILMQQEKLAGLGTMAAGLAHELNNPAAAARRSAAQLMDAVVECERRARILGGLGLTPAEAQLLDGFAAEARARATRPDRRNALAVADAELELLDWLEDHGVGDADTLAAELNGAGWTGVELAPLADAFDETRLTTVLAWLSALSSAGSLLHETRTSVDAISQVVGAVRRYIFHDQAPVQEVDVHQGLEDALLIMRHRLRNVEVVREFAPDLPAIEAYGGELNQVWSNVLSNAVDAVEGQGRIVVRTQRSGPDHVVVEIQDNGPGIPPDVQPKIFSPFFTSKEPGKGTGLGLPIARNIVVLRHRGSISFESEPGRTCFQVRLPIRLRRS